ncbi:MAG: DEAD/DEAH box helicase [Alcanivoracaceae bacterium]
MIFFDECQQINKFIEERDEASARNYLIKLLDLHERENLQYGEMVNYFIRILGLYPYIQYESASWQERIVYDSFRVDIGSKESVTLHREQSSILKRLLDGENIAVSAPTSFGKSFIIDSYISIKNPKNVVIIVPTIALTDETRRRLQAKFSNKYRIITTSDVPLSDKNIFIFPQERAISYAEKIDHIDILIVDEFYKASLKFDKDRSPSLIRAILRMEGKSSQRYFLAPNISDLKDSIFTKGMDFISLNFNTVFLEQKRLYESIGGDEAKKSKALVDILSSTDGKTLIYAGTFTNIDIVSTVIMSEMEESSSGLISMFGSWLTKNYSLNWSLTRLVSRSTGIHNGRLHRSLGQIQIRLFEEVDGLKNMVSTSSIIEGVNTSAENVVLWSNLSGRGRAKINDFTYKNIIGRGGRMFKHFVGKIYILEKPPLDSHIQLELDIPDELVGDMDGRIDSNDLTREQIAKIISYKEEMSYLFGEEMYARIQKEGVFQSSDSYFILGLARQIKDDPDTWAGIGYLNSSDVSQWGPTLYKALGCKNVAGVPYSKFVEFVKILSNNWAMSIPEILKKLEEHDVGIDEFFQLERNVTFGLSSLLGDINTVNLLLSGGDAIDISSFVSRASHAFLPRVVYELEEYGLPRMISRKIQRSGLLDFEGDNIGILNIIEMLNDSERRAKIEALDSLDAFDAYILRYFFEGIAFPSS